MTCLDTNNNSSSNSDNTENDNSEGSLNDVSLDDYDQTATETDISENNSSGYVLVHVRSSLTVTDVICF